MQGMGVNETEHFFPFATLAFGRLNGDAMIGETVLQVWRAKHHAAVWMRATGAKSQKSVALLILHGDSRIFVPMDLGRNCRLVP